MSDNYSWKSDPLEPELHSTVVGFRIYGVTTCPLVRSDDLSRAPMCYKPSHLLQVLDDSACSSSLIAQLHRSMAVLSASTAELQAASASTANVPPTCKHGLQYFHTTEDEWWCSACKRTFAVGTPMLGCRRCNVDYCTDCAPTTTMPTKQPTTTLDSADKAVPHLHSDGTDPSGTHADARAGLHADDEKDPPASNIVDEIEPAVDPDPTGMPAA